MRTHSPTAEKARSIFSATFGQSPLLVCSPGRINIIGEHTDYNEGFVLPAAIDKAAYVAISLRSDNIIHLVAADFDAFALILKYFSDLF